MAGLRIVDGGVIYRNPLPGHQTVHASLPAVLEVAPDHLVGIYRRGTSFYSSDGVLERARSIDGGRTWTEEGPVWDVSRDDRPYSYSAPFPSRLRDGTLALAAFRVDRSDRSRLMVNPTTGGFLPVEHLIATSTDLGRTWSAPAPIVLPEGQVLNLSGPVVELEDGTWFLPWDFGKAYDDPRPVEAYQIGLFSRDRGRTWGEPVTLADERVERRGYWHGRVVKLRDGRLFTLFWTGDQKTSAFQPLHAAVSDLRGRSWSRPVPTGIPGQTSWPVDLGDGRMVAVYTYREGAPPGIKAVASRDGGRNWDLDHQVQLWDATGRETIGVASKNVYPQSHDVIAFGRPYAIPTSAGDVLACFWGTEACLTSAYYARLRLE